MSYALSLIPILLFLFALVSFDSFRLIRYWRLLKAIGWGLIAAGIAFGVNNALQSIYSFDFHHYTKYAAPLIEETLKAAFVVWLILSKRTGFTIDAAIYGFAVGTGFALAENLYAIHSASSEMTWIVWLIRGFGTAVMHGGCTALFAIVLMNGVQQKINLLFVFIPSWSIAVVLHSGYNHFMINPLLQTVLIIVLLPACLALVFNLTTRSLKKWLEIRFVNEIELLAMLQNGRIIETNAGVYLKELQKHLHPEVLLDIYCYLGLYLELSIAAKRNMMLKECGFQAMIPEEITGKLNEFNQLEKRIGQTGKLALSPLIGLSQRELFNISQLKE